MVVIGPIDIIRPLARFYAGNKLVAPPHQGRTHTQLKPCTFTLKSVRAPNRLVIVINRLLRLGPPLVVGFSGTVVAL